MLPLGKPDSEKPDYLKQCRILFRVVQALKVSINFFYNISVVLMRIILFQSSCRDIVGSIPLILTNSIYIILSNSQWNLRLFGSNGSNSVIEFWLSSLVYLQKPQANAKNI